MKIIHCSDTHGRFPILPQGDLGDLVVHSGDFCPNKSRGNRSIEPQYQPWWLRSEVENIKRWLEGRPLLLCMGNHDFIDPAEILQDLGVEVISLTNKFVTFRGLGFYGFPYIPYIDGEWNFELHPQDMVSEVRRMRMKLTDAPAPINILVTHAPPWGICDYFDGQHFGNTMLMNSIAYDQFQPKPQHLLCGHIHEAHGTAEVFDIKISQAATVVHEIEVDI